MQLQINWTPINGDFSTIKYFLISDNYKKSICRLISRQKCKYCGNFKTFEHPDTGSTDEIETGLSA